MVSGGIFLKIISLSYPIDNLSDYSDTSIAIGYFDGVHRGHQVVIQNAIKQAKTLGIQSSVMTFDPHPKSVLGSIEHESFISPLPEKLSIFEEMGVDLVYVVSFNKVFSSVSPGDFIEQLLIPLKIKYVTVGFDFSFGYRGLGKAHDLKILSNNRFQVKVITSINSQAEKISSTNIRKALQIGNIDKANYYLGRKYSIQGLYHMSSKQFFSTSPSIIPYFGKYLIEVIIDNQTICGTLWINHKNKNSPYTLRLMKTPATVPKYLKVQLIGLYPKEAFQTEENHIII